MKKVLSILLTLCMLLGAMLTFSSCAAVSEDAVKNDAQKVLANAWSDTTVKFFDDNKEFMKIVSEAFKTGSVEISLQAELLEENAGIEGIKETLYFNEKDKKIASKTGVVYAGETIEALLFVDKGGITFSSESIMGDNTAYKLDPASLAEKFIDSDIASLFLGNIDKESDAVQSLQNLLDELASAYKKAFEASENDIKNDANDLLAALDQTVETKEIKNLKGESVKCVVTTYKLTNDTLVDFINKSIDIAGVDDEDFLASIDELTAIIEDNLDLDLAVSIYINENSGLIERLAVIGDASVGGSGVEIEAVLAFSDEKIELNAAVEAGGESIEFVAIIEKEVDGKNTTYTLTAEAGYDGVSVELFEASFTADKSSGDFELTVNANEYIDKNIVVKGNSKTENDTATFQIASVKYGSTTLEFDLKFTFKKSDTMPKISGEVKDVVDLTKEDIEAFVSSFLQ